MGLSLIAGDIEQASTLTAQTITADFSEVDFAQAA
jgi:hypothetical protein